MFVHFDDAETIGSIFLSILSKNIIDNWSFLSYSKNMERVP